MVYVPRFGEAKAICDRCGFAFRLPQLRKEWTGKKVCRKCWTHVIRRNLFAEFLIGRR